MDFKENLSWIVEIWQLLEGMTEFSMHFPKVDFLENDARVTEFFIKFSGFVEFFKCCLVKTS